MRSSPLLSDRELRERLSAAVSTERAASAEVIFHLAELDRRKLYLEDACSCLRVLRPATNSACATTVDP
ncbi:MAG: hypothetical protein U0263_27790 [Polyangiaceae bacterium]